MPNASNTLALCSELGLVDVAGATGVPSSVQLIPTGPAVVGRDGRSWLFDGAAVDATLRAFNARGIELPIDWEHATQHRAPKGQTAPAAAWITALNVREGALWADVRWTDRGHDQVLNREYRFLSPVFDFDPGTGRIVRLVSAGLTNTPNLPLQALNSEKNMELKLSLSAAVAAALSVSVDADEAAVLAAIAALRTAINSESRDLQRYVPRADYDQSQTRAQNAETQLRERDAAQLKASVDLAMEGALKDRKIAPASADYHRALCNDAAGLERFRAYVASAHTIAPDSGLDGRGAADASTALNAEERAVCTALGISEAAYAAERTERTARAVG